LTGFNPHAQTTFEMVQNGNSKGKLLGGTTGSLPVSLPKIIPQKVMEACHETAEICRFKLNLVV